MKLTSDHIAELCDRSLRMRERVISMACDGGCFLGASLSAVDIINYLYYCYLRIDATDCPDRDYFFLSKGHDVPALYSAFIELGWLDEERLHNHLSVSDSLYWHPNRNINGVEFHSGSLGHLLPVGCGVALDIKINCGSQRVVVMTGDGELNEGSNWEALMVANAYKLDNLVVIVDRNQFQANIATEELIPLEPLADKFRSFGANVICADGHIFESINEAFQSFTPEDGRVKVIIANTVRGKGLPSIESRADRWFCNFSSTEIKSLISELHGQSGASITSPSIIAR